MKLFKNKQSKDISVIQGGYSDVRLWPCYMIYSSLMLFFSPIIGLGLCLLIFSSIGLGIAIYASKQIPVFTYDIEAWTKDLNLALDNGLDLPGIENYQIVTPAKVKAPKQKKVARKRQSLAPFLDMATVK